MRKEIVDGYGKPVEFLFGPHGVDYVEYLDNFKASLENTLQRCEDKKVVAFLEGADAPVELAQLIFANSANGQLPSIALRNAVASSEVLIEWLGNGSADIEQPRDVTNYFEEELRILDDVSKRYSSRLLFTIEGTSKKELDRLIPLRISAQNRGRKSVELVFSGDLESALKHYKASVRFSAKDSMERERRVVGNISSLIKREDVAAVIVKFGSFHTRMAHTLLRQSYKVVWSFEDRIPGFNYIYSPREALCRKIIFTNRQPSEVEWYRSMLGSVCYRSSLIIDRHLRESGENGFNEQVLAKFTVEFCDRLVSMQKVREFIELFKLMQNEYGNSPVAFLSAAFKFERDEITLSDVNQVSAE